MGQPFTLTDGVIRVTQQTIQPMYLALDVSRYDEADIRLWVLGLEGTSPSVTVRVLTGMEKDDPAGFVVAHDFGSRTTTGPLAAFGVNLLRYVIWEVTAVGGSGSPAALFQLDGMLRSR